MLEIKKNSLEAVLSSRMLNFIEVTILPSYEQIGVFSSMILITLRLLQGFCTGGEFNGAGLYIVENTNPKKMTFYGSLISSSAAIGAILGSLLSTLVTLPLMPKETWRLAFLLGGTIGIVGIYMRRNLEDEVLLKKITQSHSSHKIPLLNSFKTAPLAMFYTLGIAAFAGAMYHLSFYYISIFLITQSHWQLSNSLLLMSLGTLFYIFIVPFFGYLADHYGNKKIMLTGSLATFIFIYPLLKSILSAHSLFQIISIQLCLAFLSAWFQASITAYMAKLFPAKVRYSSLAFSYGIGIALFGGTTPMICSLLIKWTKNPLAPSFYIMTLSLVGFLSVWYSKEKSLTE